jgi:hypothetical protein
MSANMDYPARTILPPGVHFEELAPKERPEVKTGVPLFVGFGHVTERGDCGEIPGLGIRIFRITSWEQFQQNVSLEGVDGFLDYGVRGFFENGGEQCVVVPLEAAVDWVSPGYASPGKELAGFSETGSTARGTQPMSCRWMVDRFKELFRDKGPLDDLEEVDLVCAPDIMRAEFRASPGAVRDLQVVILEYCRRMGDRFAILDCPPGPGEDGEPAEGGGATPEYRPELVRHALQWVSGLPDKGREVEGAIYYPWLMVQPLPGQGRGPHVNVPPCGHVAGIYARVDSASGVHRAPANEIVEGAMDLSVHVADREQSELNPYGVNCLVSFPRRGIRVWGARTLSGQPNWRYVNVRRIFLTLVRWIEWNMRDVVFEPNVPALWDRVRDRIGAYCYELYRRGALKGLKPAEAFFVKCDAENNPLEVREAGQLVCEIGLAPVVPAEFIVVRITRSAAGITVTSSA